MKLIARFFRSLFKIKLFRNRFFFFHKRLFQPLRLFKKVKATITYDNDLKINVELREWIQMQIYFLGYYDRKLVNFMKKNLNEGDVFFDVGGNIGCFTLLCSKLVGEKGKVVSFEPVSHVNKKLTNNVEINNLNNVTIEKKAVSNENTDLTIYVSNSENMGMSSVFRHEEENGETEVVEAIKLDDYLLNHPVEKIDVIKMDIEGAEFFALQGMSAVLKKYKPTLILEIINETDPEKIELNQKVIDFLKEHNYQQFNLDENGEVVAYQKGLNYHNYVFKQL